MVSEWRSASVEGPYLDGGTPSGPRIETWLRNFVVMSWLAQVSVLRDSPVQVLMCKLTRVQLVRKYVSHSMTSITWTTTMVQAAGASHTWYNCKLQKLDVKFSHVWCDTTFAGITKYLVLP